MPVVFSRETHAQILCHADRINTEAEMNRMTRCVTMLLLLVLTAATSPLFADRGGQTGRSTIGCGNCHGDNATPGVTITIQQPPNGIRAGVVADLSVVIAQAGQAAAGLNLAITNAQQQNAGQINAGAGSKVMNGELTHTAPKAFTAGQVTFPFTWQPPAGHGTYTLTVVGNTVNGNNRADANDQWKVANAVTLTVMGASITSPTVGQEFCRGQNLTINWTQTGYQNFRIEASANDGTTWGAVAASVAASAGTYTWAIPAQQEPSTSYRIRLVNTADGQEVQRSEAFTILAGPTIVQQPEDVNECIGGTFTLSIGLAGTDNQIRWRKNGQIIPGAVNPTLTIVNAKETDAGTYDVQVFGCGETISRAAKVAILQRPVLTRQPVAVAVCEGQSASLSVAATGDALTYQWFKNGEAIPAQTSPTLQFPSASLFDDASYYCVVTGGCTPVLTTDTVDVTILESPRLTNASTSQNLSEGDALVLSVQVVGKALAYQWFKNGAAIAGATASTYRINSVVRADSGRYTCTIKNACDSVRTDAITVSVQPASGPGVLALDQPTVSFGDVAVCERKTQVFEGLLKNRGGSPVVITSISIDPPSLVTVLDVDLPLSIPAGEARDLRLRCNPKTQGDMQATIAFFVAGVRTELTVRATVTSAARLALDTLAFIPGVDNQPVRCNTVLPIVCDSVTVTAIRLTGAGAASYRLVSVPALPTTLPKGETLGVCLEAVGPTGGTATVSVETSSGNGQFVVVRDMIASVDASDQASSIVAPNPMYDRVTITIPTGTHMLRIVDIHGATVVRRQVNTASIDWNGVSDQGAMVAPGMYTVMLETATHVITQPLLRLR
ncbi:MAG: hypothetical protein FGM24_04290 [Candidatus Kapabacteria bacterium]|nr:hypothetical protein [Candidatus Kapabacteria bacterium]